VAERQGRHHADPRNRRQAACRLIRFRQPADFIVELALLLADIFMNGQERLDHAEKLMTFAQQLTNQIAELQTDRAWKQQPAFFDQAADLVLDIPADGDEPGSFDFPRP